MKQMTTEERFNYLRERWEDETAFLSSSTAIDANVYYQEIIAMGKDVLPLIFADMEKTHSHWFTALRILTGADPVDESDWGKIGKMVEVWLEWAKQNGY